MTWPYVKRKKEVNLRFGLWAEMEFDKDGNAFVITFHQIFDNRGEEEEETFTMADMDKRRIKEWLELLAKEATS